jgi:HEAT repeat protein
MLLVGGRHRMAPEVLVEPLRNAVLVLSAAVLLFLLLLLVERSLAAVRSARTERHTALLTTNIYRAVQGSGGAGHLGKLSHFDRRVVRGILLRLALDLRGDSGDVIVALYRTLGFLNGDLKRLRSWRSMTRASAAADLGLIRTTDSVPALSKILDDPDVRVRQTAVWALGQIGGPETLMTLVRLLGDPSRIVARRVEEVLAERGREIKAAILQYAAKTAVRAGRLAAIELLGWLRIAEGSELLVDSMGDLDPEVRIKSVKAAAAIGDPRFVDVFHRLLDDPRWEVRCQAAKGLGVFGSPASISRLDQALRDPSWWVRFYAATALAETGPLGEEALQRALRDPQPPVREMARYLLERGDVVPALP